MNDKKGKVKDEIKVSSPTAMEGSKDIESDSKEVEKKEKTKEASDTIKAVEVESIVKSHVEETCAKEDDKEKINIAEQKDSEIINSTKGNEGIGNKSDVKNEAVGMQIEISKNDNDDFIMNSDEEDD